ncbi:glycoside hydrolase [Sphingomonas panacis]|uniref:Glycoside hydrolase n=1 Tax=Sphingomonas panacis TaxID=1560345 RepID=A0A1B3ZC37_9SPHN|nr:glycoside hydrolase family 2 TIM barrel-domain containing protein [Sphingomonas panacis]AOH84982.1 glycoside hydrolase [Sphingomonas panacis]
MRLLWASASCAALCWSVAATGQTPDARPTVQLSDGWRFKQDDALRGVESPSFRDADWSVVSVPHTWNRVGYYLPDPATHLNRRESINKAQGIGWYRLGFTPSADLRGKRNWLEFDAASRVATVWLNGTLLGTHQGGFSRFRLDATDALRPGERNLLVVKTDNTKPAPGTTTADTLPLNGDFFVHGGLYRPVRLITTDPVHIDMLDAGGPGVYATTQAIDGARATVGVEIKLRNDGSAKAPVRIVTRLIDAAGNVAADAMETLSLAQKSGGNVRQSLAVPNAHLWQGTTDPYLYRLLVEVLSANGRVLDRVDQTFGIRQMRFDPARGLFLNGKPYPLHGVGYHQDREGKGWAIDATDTEQDVAILREMGANTIRLTHYQHGQPIHDLADRYGLIVWDEIPLVSQWTLGGAKQASPGLLANARQQLTEEIRQNGNHASVANWGIANEVDFGNSLPAFLAGAAGTPPDPMPLLRELNTLEHQLDPSRPSSLATCCEGRLFAAGVDVPVTAPAADLGGANRYFGWYYGTPSDLGPALDALHAKRPDQPLAVTEFGGGGATTVHTDNVLGGPVDSRGRMQPEEVESWIHEGNWAVLASKPYLWASWLWAGFDFASTVRQEGDATDINTKGLVTFDRKIRKDAYYFYKANWSAMPTVHVTGRRYVDRALATTEVRVYSNAPSTELLVNGKSIGTLAACPQKICIWPAVRLARGANQVVARGTFPQAQIEDTIAWHVGDDVARAVRIDSGALVAGASSTGHFGSDTFFTGGTAATVDKPADYGKPTVATPIAGTADGAIAATYRKGDFAYRVPLDDGRYTVTLTFVEPSAKPGERIFDVLADGVPTLRALDVAKAAGAPLTALRRSFPVTVRGGLLTLAFRPSKSEAIVSAVEVAR